MDSEAEFRRKARATWPVVRTTLAEDSSDVVVSGTPAERIAMVHRLTLDAWAMSGRPIPTVRRDEMSGRLVRLVP